MIYALIIGAISGYLAGWIRQGDGYGVIGNIFVGIIGAYVGNWVFRKLDISIASGILGDVITGVVGALIFLFLLGLVRVKR
jgi:uncharacterized membrane protein YeaQ/YmgE (transglycosylase-associated protein family)